MRKKLLGMFSSALMVLSLFVAMPVKANNTNVVTVTTAEDFAKAVEDAVSGTPIEISLENNITVGELSVKPGTTITVNGNDYTITLSANSIFNYRDPLEGIQKDVTLILNDINFKSSGSGYPVVLGFKASGTSVTYTDCTFTDLYEGLYANPVTDANAEKNTVEFTNCKFTNVKYYYGYDDGAGGTSGSARVDKHEFVLNNVTTGLTAETWAVASVDGIGYKDLNAAITAAQSTSDKTVTLRKDVELNSMLTLNTEGMTLDLNKYQITGGTTFTGTGNAAHLVDITANNVTLKNGTLVAGGNNNHTLNVWNADGVNLSNLTLDNSKAGLGGAPLIVGASDVTVSGELTTITGGNSWYAINVDSRNVSNTATPGSLTFAENAVVNFEGLSEDGIYVENDANTDVEVAFGKNVTLTSDIENFVPLALAKNVDATISNPSNAGLVVGSDGSYEVVDKSVLSDLINDHKTLTAEDFTAETWAAYTKVLNAAMDVLNDDQATQKEVDAAVKSLTTALRSLEKVTTVEPAPQEPSKEETTKPTEDTTTTEKPVQTPATDEKTESPETGAMITTGLFASMAILSGAIAIVLKKKKELN